MIKQARSFFLFLIVTFCLTYNLVEAKELREKKYDLSISAIFKNEARYFKEWIEYHRLVGVDHFYLYNNGSTDNFSDVLTSYIQDGTVTLINWPDGQVPPDNKKELYSWVYYTQVPAYEDACRRSAKETTWLAMIDIDEFMVPISSPTMKALLEKYSAAPGIMLYWHLYGTSGVLTLPPQKLLIEVLHMTARPEAALNKRVVKSIVKPDLYKVFSWPPHVCVFENGEKAICLEKSEAKLNHYVNRTVDYFLSFKVTKKEHMDNRKLSAAEIQSWMNVGNEVEDQERTILRFVPTLRRQMGYN